MMPGLPTRLSGDAWAVRTSGLRKSYGRTVALRGIDLTVPEGAVYVLIGPNGAGKSTALRILLDLTRADAGTVDALGLDPRRDVVLNGRAGLRANGNFRRTHVVVIKPRPAIGDAGALVDRIDVRNLPARLSADTAVGDVGLIRCERLSGGRGWNLPFASELGAPDDRLRQLIEDRLEVL